MLKWHLSYLWKLVLTKESPPLRMNLTEAKAHPQVPQVTPYNKILLLLTAQASVTWILNE